LRSIDAFVPRKAALDLNVQALLDIKMLPTTSEAGVREPHGRVVPRQVDIGAPVIRR
jgi:uncharacterized protein (DUF736 family)